MTETIIAVSALITALGSIFGTIFSYRKVMALVEYRLTEVEKRLDQHNHYAEKLSEMTIAVTKI